MTPLERLERQPMSPLRRRFIDDLRLRNLSPRTIETYVIAVLRVARHFQRSPERLSDADVRAFQLHLLERKVSWCLYNQTVCALRFLYGTTLQRPDMVAHLPFGRRPQPLPGVLSPDEVANREAATRRLPKRSARTQSSGDPSAIVPETERADPEKPPGIETTTSPTPMPPAAPIAKIPGYRLPKRRSPSQNTPRQSRRRIQSP